MDTRQIWREDKKCNEGTAVAPPVRRSSLWLRARGSFTALDCWSFTTVALADEGAIKKMCCENDPARSHVAEDFGERYSVAPLQANYQAYLMTSVVSAFRVVADYEWYCQIIPNLNRVTLVQNKQGLIRRCDFGNDMILEERIVSLALDGFAGHLIAPIVVEIILVGICLFSAKRLDEAEA